MQESINATGTLVSELEVSSTRGFFWGPAELLDSALRTSIISAKSLKVPQNKIRSGTTQSNHSNTKKRLKAS